MSSSHWESSQRPLFVKSVWLNGYRHAILSKEDPLMKCEKRSSSRLRSRGQTSARSKSKNSSTSDESLIIPAVQLLLANGLKEHDIDKPKKKLVKALTYNFISREQVTLNIKNVDVEVNLTPNTKQLSRRYFPVQTEQKIIKNDSLDQCSSSLTERVLLWLDLAGRYPNELYKNDEDSHENKTKSRNVRKENKRIVTAHPNASFTVHQSDNHFVRKCTKHIYKEESLSENDDFDDFSILKGHRTLHNKSPLHEIVTSQIEIVADNRKKNDDNENIKFSSNLSKRQVHIFMPLVKKYDNPSLISGSGSTNISMSSFAKNS